MAKNNVHIAKKTMIRKFNFGDIVLFDQKANEIYLIHYKHNLFAQLKAYINK